MNKMNMPFKNVIKILAFIMFSVISLSTLSFSFYKLSGDTNDIDRTLYVSIITSILGIFTPSPVNLISSIKNSNDVPQKDMLLESKKQKKQKIVSHDDTSDTLLDTNHSVDIVDDQESEHDDEP